MNYPNENFDKKINVLIPDGEAGFTLSVVRTLSQIKNFVIHVIYSSEDNIQSKYSKYVNNSVFYYLTNNEVDFVNLLIREIKIKKIDILLPLHFSAFSLVSKFKRKFQSIGFNILVSSIELLEKVNNKYELSKLLELHKISAPKTYKSNEDLNNVTFPLLYKPIEEYGGIGIKLLNSQVELNNHLSTIEDSKFILQEFIKGYDIDCSILSKEGKILAYTIQKGYISSSISFGPSLGIEFLYEHKLFKLIEKLIKCLNWTGVAHIDLRYDEIDKNFKVIEINPRFWGTIEGSKSVGVNFPYLYCLTSLGIEFKTPKYKFEKFANNKGFKKIIRSYLGFNKNKIEFPKNLSIQGDIFDPKPLFAKLLLMSKKILSIIPF